MPDILDSKEAADYLRVNAYTLRRLSRDGELPAFKVGTAWRYKKRDLDDWARSQQDVRRKLRILVVDDESTVRDYLRLILEKDGCEVVEAAHGGEAIEHMRRQRADLIFLDLVMPHMNGPDTLKAVRESWPEVPVAILTAYPESDLMEQALLYSPVTLLAKPATRDRIRACVQHHSLPALARQGTAL